MLGDNGTVTYVAMGQTGAGLPLRYETTDTLAATGGDDTISVGDGNNTILGGMGADTITSGNGTDTILGDNGFVQMDAVGNNYAQIGTKSQTSAGGGTTDLGGNDIIHAGSGNKNVLGGDGADSIILGAGNHIVLGDNGTVTYVAMGQVGAGLPLRYETTDTLAATGGDDTISVGDGNNTILGGMGADTITSGNGTDTILGDNGFVQMDAVGNNYAQIGTKSQTSAGGGTTDLGGNDVITALDGTKTVLGGDGMDTITLGVGSATASNHIVLGDNGTVTYVAMGQTGAGLPLRYETTDTLAATGGDDTISVGDGNNTILGGMGADTITSGNGTDTILGDNGFVQMDAVGNNYAQIGTKSQTSAGGGTTDLGGNDVITALDGTKTVLGGDGMDTITLGVGSATASNHIVLGDNGTVTYVAMGQMGAGLPLRYETTDTLAATGGDDTISVGDGNNTILGGMGADTITSGNGTDTILGDNGFVQMDAVGNNYAQIGTKSQTSAGGGTTDLGGNDIIHAGSGNKNVLGGDGADSIILGAGNHIVLGDNGTVTYVAMGQTGAGLPLRYETTDTLAATGGDDTISVGDGNNTILGGMGADTITSGNGTDTILGDNGFVQMDAVGNNYAQIGTKSQTSAGGGTTDLGGNDVITALDGTKTVLGGDGMDTITLGVGSATASNHIVLGDNGTVTYVAMGQVGAGLPLRYETTDTLAATGGDDTISVGDGNNTILGGMGADTITSGNGTDTILGDNGFVQMDATGQVFQRIESTVTLQGGNDVIAAGDGNKSVIGGYGNDSIAVGTGTHTLLGDNGSLTFSTSGVLALVRTTEQLIGGDDQIVAAGGDTIVLAGLGSDTVSTGAGNDVLLGDDGFVALDALGRLSLIETTQPTYGGTDSLSAGGGNNVVMGGYGEDRLIGGSGNDMLLGDSGRVTYIDGRLNVVESIDPFIGSTDFLDGRGGQNVIIGGAADDLMVGNLSDDILAGDYASVTFDASGHVTSVLRYGAGDLISRTQESFFAYTQPEVIPRIIGAVYRGASIRIGDAITEGERLGDYVILPSLSGFEFSALEHHSDSSGPAQTVQSDQQSGAGGTSQSPGDEQRPADGDEHAPPGPRDGQGAAPGDNVPAGKQGGAGAQGPAPNSPSSTPSIEGTNKGNPPATKPPQGADGQAGNLRGITGTDSIDRLARDDSSRLKLGVAGLLGAQAWQGNQRAGASPRAGAPARPVASGSGGGTWIRSETGRAAAAEEVLLDRRARRRAEASAPRIASGAIEQAAHNWLDSALGMHTSVETCNYEAGTKPGLSIDWGGSVKPETAADVKKNNKPQKTA